MENAAQYHIGNHTANPKGAAKGTASGFGQLHSLDAKAKGRTGGKKGQKEVRTATNATNGFLRSTFLPKLCTEHTVEDCTETIEMERGFYTSLSLLTDHYQIELQPTQDYRYPYNAALAYGDAQNKLAQKHQRVDRVSVVTDNGLTYMVTEESCGSVGGLYYVPIVPLYRMLHNPIHRHTAKLLLSVCAYLYHVADIPYYRQQSSYLYYIYMMLDEWLDMEEETDSIEVYKREITIADWVGDHMEKKLFNIANLKFFGARLENYTAVDDFDAECLSLARKVFSIYRQYPQESIFRNIPIRDHDPNADGDEQDEAVPMDRYISFIADSRGLLYETLYDSLNNDFNQYASLEEPTLKRHFNGEDINGKNLDFENRLFIALGELAYLLFNYR